MDDLIDEISRACLTKRAYPTRKDALTAVNGRNRGSGSRRARGVDELDPNRRGRRHHKPKQRLGAYPCSHCNNWHLTRRP